MAETDVTSTAGASSALTSTAGITLHSPTEQPTDYTKMDYMGAPCLYNTTADDLTTMGLGSMPEATWSIKRSASAFPTLTMTYPLSGPLAQAIQPSMIIMADGGFDWKRQLFRIDSVEPDLSEGAEPILSISATHVAGDVVNDVLTKDIQLSNATLLQAFSAVLEMLAEPMPRATFYTDILAVGNVNWEQSSSVQDIMFGRTVGGTDMESLFDGEWVFDNYDFRFLKHGGVDRGVIVKPGKNLLSYEIADSLDSTYTAVYPYAKFTPDISDGGGDESNIEKYKGAGTIQWLGSGGVPVWDTPFKDQKKTGKTLKNGTSWKVFAQVTTGGVGDHTWYNLGGNQWIDASYFTFDKDGDFDIDYAVNKVVGYGTIAYSMDNALSKRHREKVKETGTIQWLGKGGVPVWDSPFTPQKKTGKQLKNGDAFKVFEKATDENDKTWYCLGGNQWVLGDYLTFSKLGDYEIDIASNTVTGYGTITATATVYVKPSGKTTGRKLSTGTRWKIFSVAAGGDGVTWYNLGGNQWIKADNISFTGNKDIEPQAKEDTTSEDEAGVAPVYSSPDGKKATGKTLASGTRWKIFGQATTADGTWYNLGGNQWIKADYMTFDGKEDIEPQAPEEDEDDTDPVEQLVVLDEAMVVADGCDKYERQRIVSFDASEYNVQDADTLRKVTQAYIADNRIGKPDYSLTIAYSDMTGELAHLSWLGFYDYCVVYLPQTSKDTYGEVTELNWDGNLHRNTTVTLGNRPPSVSHELDGYKQEAEDAAAKTAKTEADNAKTEAQQALAQQRQDMTDSIKAVTDAFTERADAFDKRVEEAEATAESRDKDIRTELNNTAKDIDAKFTTYKTGFDAQVTALDGRMSENTQTISGFQKMVEDPSTGLASVNKQLAGLVKTQITSADLSTLKTQTEELIQSKVTDLKGDYDTLSQMIDGLSAKVGDTSIESRLEIFKNEIGSQITDKVSGLTNTIDQKIEDGVSSITLAVDSSGTGLQLIGPNGDKGSVAYLNFDSTIANALHSLDSLSMVSDYGRIDMTSWGITVHGSAGHAPTVEIGTPSVSGTLHVNGTTYIDGTLHIVEPSSSQGAYLYYTSTGFKGAGIYVHFSTGDYLLASFNGKTNLQAA